MSSIGKLMKQAARMQQQMEQVQAQLAARTVEATSGGGAVKVAAKCDGSVVSVKMDPQALNPSDAQLLEDMVVTACKPGTRRRPGRLPMRRRARSRRG
jgi:DNA-binding YbaB/EbfC family protein